MRRMRVHPAKVIECSFKNDGITSIVDVPIKNLNDLPITFDLIIPTLGLISHAIVWYSSINDEVHGGGCFLNPGDNRGAIIYSPEASSLTVPELPYLELLMSFENNGINEPPITQDDRVFVTNITNLEQGVIDYKI